LLKVPVEEPEKERLPVLESNIETVVVPELNVIAFPLVLIESTASVPEFVTVTFARILEQLDVVGQLFEQSVGSG
jgi:hypothetical protein